MSLYGILRKRLEKIRNSFEPFIIYYKVYGGVSELLLSPYLWLAAGLTYLCNPFWLEVVRKTDSRPAIELALTFVPGLMAFTLSGMAVVLALSGRKFIDSIRENGKYDSLFMQVVVLFFHFLLVQSLALILSIVSQTYPYCDALAGIAFFLSIYGVCSAVAIASMLLNISRIYNLTGGGDANS